ncbi:MAG TPA: hypothetical protein VGF47_05900, partial [Solirubrobacteraceae bacterium]
IGGSAFFGERAHADAGGGREPVVGAGESVASDDGGQIDPTAVVPEVGAQIELTDAPAREAA